jgi:hypothetical protein
MPNLTHAARIHDPRLLRDAHFINGPWTALTCEPGSEQGLHDYQQTKYLCESGL